MSMEPDAVVGSIPLDSLADLLTTIHRSGHGHNTRVFDPRRGDLNGQLARAGVPAEVAASDQRQDSAIVLIHAPSRATQVADLLRRGGAFGVQTVVIGRPSHSSLMTFDPAILAKKKARRPAKTGRAPVSTPLDDGVADRDEHVGESQPN